MEKRGSVQDRFSAYGYPLKDRYLLDVEIDTTENGSLHSFPSLFCYQNCRRLLVFFSYALRVSTSRHATPKRIKCDLATKS